MGHIIPAFTVYLARICLNSTKDDFLYIRHSYSPVENLTPAASWWARVVPTHLLPKETDLQSAAVADLLLTHITILFNLDKKHSETCRTITFIHIGAICSLSVTYGYHLLGGQKQLVKTTYAT